MRARLLAGLVLVGCAGAPAAGIEGPRSVAPTATVSVSPSCADTPRPAPIAVEPDPARLADLEKATSILASPAALSEFAPRIAPDGLHVAYFSNAGGSRALYLGDLTHKQPPRRIVAALPPRVRRPRFSSDGSALYFTSDEHGDEAYALFRLTLASGAIEALTPGERLHRDGPWLGKTGDRLLFTARPMNAHGTVLFEHGAGSGATPAQLFASESVDLRAVRGDLGQVLLAETAKANELFTLDLPAKAAPRRLYPDAGSQVTIWDATYSPDGARVYVATDDGGERATVLALDAKSGKILRRWVEAKFPVSKAQELIAHGDRVAFIVDAGTRQEVRILDASMLTPIAVTPELPLGSSVPGAMHPNLTSGLDLAADGKHLVVEWSTPTLASRIYTIDAKTGARSLLTEAPASALGTEVMTRIEAIPTYDGLLLPTLVHVPGGTSATKRRPVVVQMHGGFPYASTARFDPKITLLLSEGYAVVEPNVRGSGGFGRAFELADDGVKKLDAVRDLGVVARWVAAQPWADPKRLALTGGSVGGYYTLMGLEHDPELWRCGLALVPIFDVLETVRATDGELRDYMEHKEMVPLAESMLLAAISPSTYVERIRAPLFLYAATGDVRAPIGQAEALVRALRQRGGPLEYMRSQEGHSIVEPSLRAELFARMLGFLRMHMPE